MANRTVSVRYILDASGYRSGANDIAAADSRIAASARAAAATMDQQQAKATRGQEKATKAYVAGGKAQAEAVTKVGKVTTQQARIQEDAARKIARVQEDTTRKIAAAKTDQARQEIAAQAITRQARIAEDAEVRASRAAQEAASKTSIQASQAQAREQSAATKATVAAQRLQAQEVQRSAKAQNQAAAQAQRSAAQVAKEEQRNTAARTRTLEQAARNQERLEVRQSAAARREVRERQANFTRTAQASTEVGRTALVTGGLIAAGLGLSARAAIQWQSDFTGVSKTVNGSNEQLNALEGQLRGLTRTIPRSGTELAAIAENAGQLGIQTGSIAAFTKTIAQLGDTTNLSTDEASTGLAQLGNIMGTLDGPASQVNDTISRTASTIVGLGNNGASTEKDILSLGLRIAGAGRAIGLNTGEVLGFSSAIASTGVEAEAGGTGFSNFAFKVDAAVRAGGPKLELLAKTAGQSSKEFQQAYGVDSAKALQSFIEGLGKAGDAGEDTNGILKGLGVTGIREADVIRRLAQSGNLLRDSLQQQSKAYGDNNALTNEATKRYETNASRIQIAVNKIKDDAIDIGGATLPVIASVTDQVGKYADAFKGLSPETQGGLVKGGAIAAGVLLVGGAALSAAGSVANLASNLKTLGATGPKVTAVGKSLGTFGLVAAAGYAALQGAVSIQENFIGRSQIASIDDANTALLGLAKTGNSSGLDSLFKYVGQGNKGLSSNGLVKITTDVNSMSDAFKVLNNPRTFDTIRGGLDSVLGAIGIDAGKGGLKTAAADIAAVDQSLKGLVLNGQGKDAAKAFAQITPQALAAGDSVTTLAQKFPEYAKAVNLATETNGYHIASDQELVDIMGGKIPKALADAAKGNKNLAGAVSAVTGANLGQTKTLDQQFASITKNTSGILGLRSARNDLEGSIDNANVALKQNGRTLDANTEKGRQNRTALDNIAVATLNYAQQQQKQGKSALQIAEANERGRQAYIRSARAFGQSKSAATANANDIFKLPKSIRTQVVIDVKGGASKKDIHDLNVDLKGLTKEQKAKVVITAEKKGLDAAQKQVKEFKKPIKQEIKQEVKTAKVKQTKPKPIKQEVLNQFSTEKAPTPKPVTQKVRRQLVGGSGSGKTDSQQPKTLTQKVKRVFVGGSGSGKTDSQSPKGGTVKYKSQVTAPKVPSPPKGSTIKYKSKVDAPKAPKPPKGSTITYKVKVDKTAKVPVPKGGTVKIKTDVDLSGVRRAKAGVSGVKGKSVSIKTSANLSGVSRARSAINSLPSSKTITITTIKREVTKKAGGGKVTGPGTNTSDSIDAKLSDEEWVIRATSSKRYGDGIMAALNAGSIPRSVLEPYSYATGGKAGLPPMGFAKGGKVSLSQLLAAIRDDDPLADVNDAKKGSKAFKEALKEAAKAVRDFGKTLTDQYTSSSTNGGDQLLLQQQGITDLKGLQEKIDKLQALGLDDTQIAQIVKRASEGDVAGASALADSIIDGGKGLVDQLNAAAKELAKIANFLAGDTQTKKVRGLATGGQVEGPGTTTSDTAGLFALSRREWVHPAAAVDFYGDAFMAAVQNRTLPRQRVSGYMANGGGVGVKVVQAPNSTGDFVRALEGMTVLMTNPLTGQEIRTHMRVVADQQIGSVLTGAGGSR